VFYILGLFMEKVVILKRKRIGELCYEERLGVEKLSLVLFRQEILITYEN